MRGCVVLTGQVGICLDGTAFWPRVIQRVTASRAHHVVVALSETECLSAEPGGARIRPIAEFGNAAWSRFELTHGQRRLISQLGRTLEGHPYNTPAFILVGVQFLTGRHIPARVFGFVSSMRGAECAQLADALLTAAGVHVFGDGREPGFVYPGSFEKLFRFHGWPLSIT